MRPRIDHLGVGRADVRPHGGNLAALHQHVGLLEVADRSVEREHAAALDQNGPARSGRPAGLLRTRSSHDRAGDGRGSGGAGRGGAEELAARHRRRRGARTANAESHGLLPNTCCCNRGCYPRCGSAASEAAFGELGVGRCPPVRAALTARVGQDLAVRRSAVRPTAPTAATLRGTGAPTHAVS